ncbi:AAA family ATPase [Planococcus sp. MB-3u-03]|uniref:AAA family ATPase n=1 Tax=Planococcus sp. MB-3u-03 TaxID=2058136 RepID=UPI003FA6E37A
MNNTSLFIETNEYKRFAEFCDACIKYRYMGVCYGLPGVGKTLSSRYYAHWDYLEKQISYRHSDSIGIHADEKFSIAIRFYTAPAVSASRMTREIGLIDSKLNMVKSVYQSMVTEEPQFTVNSFEDIDLLIVDEIDRLKLQNLEQLRDIYDQNDIAIIFIGMPGIENDCPVILNCTQNWIHHEFDRLSKDETHHLLTYKWQELNLPIKLEDFSDYEALASIIKITNGISVLFNGYFHKLKESLKLINLLQLQQK